MARPELVTGSFLDTVEFVLVQNRNEARGFFVDVWAKHKGDGAMEPLEKLVASVILQHPEYHRIIESQDAVARDYPEGFGESNPFLHMSLHVTICEQLLTDRPTGVVATYRRLLEQRRDAHGVEHRMMECLGGVLWSAQTEGRLPDEQAYVECLERIT